MQIRIIGIPPDAEPSPTKHQIVFDRIDGDTVIYRYAGTAQAVTAPQAGHQHDPSSFLASCGACLDDARHQFHGQQAGHADFVNEILERAPEAYDGDSAAEAIAVEYVRDLERFRADLLGALNQITTIAGTITPIFSPARALDTVLRFVNRFDSDIRVQVRLAPESDIGHVHAPVCGPGCPAFEVARAWADELPEHCDSMPWDRRTPENQALLQKTAASLLDKGLISR